MIYQLRCFHCQLSQATKIKWDDLWCSRLESTRTPESFRVNLSKTRRRKRYAFIGTSRTLYKPCHISDGLIYVSGIDIIDGTPIIDIKPYIEKYDKPPDTSIDLQLVSILFLAKQSDDFILH